MKHLNGLGIGTERLHDKEGEGEAQQPGIWKKDDKKRQKKKKNETKRR
jgi:hypothetical protein